MRSCHVLCWGMLILAEVTALCTTQVAYSQVSPSQVSPGQPGGWSGGLEIGRPTSAFPSLEPDATPLRIPIRQPGNQNNSQPNTSTTSNSPVSIVWSMSMLALICASLLIGSRMMKKKMGVGVQTIPNEALDLLGRKILGPGQQIFLMRCGSKILVVGASAEGLRTLSEITDPVEVDLLAGLCKERDEPAFDGRAFWTMFSRSDQSGPGPSIPVMSPSSQSLDIETDDQAPPFDSYGRLRENLSERMLADRMAPERQSIQRANWDRSRGESRD